MVVTPNKAQTAPLGVFWSPNSQRMARRVARVAAAFAVVVGFLLTTRDALAYPWMLRHDYAACSMCHADPSGAGILTAYGRAQSEILLRTRWGEVKEDEDPAKLGGFAFGVAPLPEWLDLQADGRMLAMRIMPPSPAPAISRNILMQADAAAAVRVDRFRASGTLGYIAEGALGASVTRGDEKRLVSRQHWAGIAFGEDDAFLLRAGRMNLPFGLRILEHTSYVRRETRTDINAAQQHGIAFAWNQPGLRAEAMAILGNFQLRPDALRDRGLAGYLEHSLDTKLAVGASTMITHAATDAEFQTSAFRQAHGLFGRYTPVKPLVLMMEADILAQSPKGKPIDVGATALLQADVEPIQGIHVAGTGEFLTKRFADPLSYRGWLSAFWFFLPHVDIRADIIYQSDPTNGGRSDTVSILGQLHGWL